MDTTPLPTLVCAFDLDRFTGSASEEIFAIGDVHGRADLLELAFRAIEATDRVPGRTRRVILLGDLIDRGHQSMVAVGMAMTAAKRLDCEVTVLMGNHEMMLAIAATAGLPRYMRAAFLKLWHGNGGDATVTELESEGHPLMPLNGETLAEALGPDRLSFLQNLPSHYRPENSDIIFVHAGLHPYVGLDEFFAATWRDQANAEFSESRSWCWVREPFLDHVPSHFVGKVGHHGCFVVHGHTPQDGVGKTVEVQVSRDRLNLDVMAVYRDRLRAARFVGNRVEVFEVSPWRTRD